MLPSRRVVQPEEEIELHLQEFSGNVNKAPSIDKQTAYDEDRLVVWPGRIAKFSKIPGFVDETDFQQRLSEKALATMRWPRDPPPAWESATESFQGENGRELPETQVNDGAEAVFKHACSEHKIIWP